MSFIDTILNFFTGKEEKPKPSPAPQPKSISPITQETKNHMDDFDKILAPDPQNSAAVQTTLKNLDIEKLAQAINEDADLQKTFKSASSLYDQSTYPILNNPQKDRQALLTRFANVSSFFEVEAKADLIEPLTTLTPNDIPARKPALRFYNCSADEQPGLTIGYGSYFRKNGGLIDEDKKEFLPYLTLYFSAGENKGKEVFFKEKTDINGNKKIVAVPKDNLTQEEIIAGLATHEKEKELEIKDLLQNMGTTKNPDKKNIDGFEYEISDICARDLLYSRYTAKNKNMYKEKYIGDKKPSILVEWLANDMHYQGLLKNFKGKEKLKADIIDKRNLAKATLPVCDKQGRQKKDKNGKPLFSFSLRRLSRRIVADLHNNKIKENPFPPKTDPIARKKHAELLSKHCAAYVTQMIGAKDEGLYNSPIANKLAEELTSLALIQIKTEQYGRDLRAEEINATRLEAKNLVQPYLSLKGSHNKKTAVTKVVNDTEKLLKANKATYLAQQKLEEAKNKSHLSTLKTLNKSGQKIVLNQTNISLSAQKNKAGSR